MRSYQSRKSALLVLISVALVATVCTNIRQVSGSPIVSSGNLLSPWQVPAMRHSASFMRDPMPWEDGYFDPSYHAWPKSRQQQVGDKQSVNVASWFTKLKFATNKQTNKQLETKIDQSAIIGFGQVAILSPLQTQQRQHNKLPLVGHHHRWY